MRYELMEYQREAVVAVLERLRWGGQDWRRDKRRSSFALSAVTGAGKTVIATACVEAILFGSSDFDADPDPNASFLWITDDPALNRQTRNRMLDASDLLPPKLLVELDDSFLDARLRPGRVYFLNTQKLSKASRLVQNTNLRQMTFWDVLNNTVTDQATTLYLILDEAHRGMKRTTDRATIVQRLINGDPGTNPPVPIVWGISATIERFTIAMGQAQDRTVHPHVAVDIDKVRASGLVKDEIGLEQPDEHGTFSTTLLRDAVRTARQFEARWAAYSASQNEPDVLPVMVIQVPDKASDSKIGELLQVVESEWPGLAANAIVHVFGEHEPIVLGSRTINWVYPESIQSDNDIRVVLAKEAISTGWDCPRAEVLYSERPAKDSTHIAQVIGRMVRQPLAHRIATDDSLNSVSCYLPLFDRKALSAIKDELEGRGRNNGDFRLGADVVRAATIFERNQMVAAEVFDFIETLPSIPVPDASANPLRRAKMLVRLLADDAGTLPLLADAGALLTKTLNARLDGLAAEHADAVAANVADIRSVDLQTTKVTIAGGEIAQHSRQIETHAKDMDRDTRRAIAKVKEGVAKTYYSYRAQTDPDRRKLDIRIEVAALLGVDGVKEELDASATKFVQDHLARFSVEIKNTTGAVRDAYRKVQELTTRPEPLTIELRDNESAATRNGKGEDLPTFEGHIYSNTLGLYSANLNEWEARVIRAEIARPSFLAWYRNPQRATPNSLRIAYQDDAGNWSSLQTDFLVISRRDDGTLGASIVDPHGDHLADAKAKLHALADFAEEFGSTFLRISSIAEGADGTLRSLDLLDAPVRSAVRAFKGAKVSAMYDSKFAEPYQ